MKKEHKSIYSAMVAFQKDCPSINLDSEVEVPTKNGAKYKFKYASLANIVNTIRPIMSEHGLGFTHLVTNEGVQCVIFHESGEEIKSQPYK